MCEIAFGNKRANQARGDVGIGGIERGGLPQQFERVIRTTTLIELFGNRFQFGHCRKRLSNLSCRSGPNQPSLQVRRIDCAESHADFSAPAPIALRDKSVGHAGERSFRIDQRPCPTASQPVEAALLFVP